MDERQKDLTVKILRAVPPTIGALFGDILTKVMSVADLTGKGWEWLIKRNQEDLEEYWREADLYFAIDDARKSAENIQFLREWVTKIAFETREEKRKRLLNVAINYHKKNNPFDEKFAFLNLLDKMSAEEIVFLLKIYKQHSSKNPIYLTPREISLAQALAGYGLLQMDFSSIDKSLEKVGESIEKVWKGKLEYGRPYNHFFDKPRLEYEETEFGKRFIDFIERKTESDKKDVKGN